MMNRVEWLKANRVKFIFLSEWMVYLIFELFMGRFTHWSVLLVNLLPFIFFYLIAILMSMLSKKTHELTLLQVTIWVITLIACDHLVKFVIRSFIASGRQIPLLGNWLFISNVLNEHGSFVTSRFDLNWNMAWMIGFNIIILFFLIQGFNYYLLKHGQRGWINLTRILLLAGAGSSLIDKLFFGGSLDFLGLDGLFVADLKDFYLTIGIGCVLVEVVENPEVDTKGGVGDDFWLIKDFLQFCFSGRLANQADLDEERDK